MVHKSFLRDKKTKIYIIIFSFIFSIFFIITIGRREFLNEYNHNYENSFLYLEDSKSIADLKNNAMIKDVNEVIKADIYFLLMDESIENENKIVLPSFFNKTYNLGDIFSFNLNDETYDFTISDFYDTEEITTKVYISKKDFNRLLLNNKSGHIVIINSWSNLDKVNNYIKNRCGVEPDAYITSTSNMDLTVSLHSFNIYALVIYVVFFIICIVSLYDISKDNKIKKNIYRSLGYSKKQIIIKNLLNIFLIFFISLIISLFLSLCGMYIFLK